MRKFLDSGIEQIDGHTTARHEIRGKKTTTININSSVMQKSSNRAAAMA